MGGRRKGAGGKAQAERKENQVGKKGKGRREGNKKSKRERTKKAKKGREEKGIDGSTEKIQK